MKCQIIFNGFQPDACKKAREIRSVLEQSRGLELESVMVICPSDGSVQELCALLPGVYCTVVKLNHWQPEVLLDNLVPLLKPDMVYLLGSDGASRELAIRLGARTNGCGMAGVRQTAWKNGSLQVRRAVYAGHLEAAFETERLPCFFSIAPGGRLVETAVFAPEIQQVVEITVSDDAPTPVSHIHSHDAEDSPVLVVAGRGLGSADGVSRAERLAERISAGFGVTKAVASLGWASMDRIVGISGIMARPERCLVLGASGAPAFYAGISASPRILSVNTDPNAPIIPGSDYVMQCDAVAVVNEALEQLSTPKEDASYGIPDISP